MWVKLSEILSFGVFFFCRTEGISMLRNELIQKEMVEWSETSKSFMLKNFEYDMSNFHFFVFALF